MHKNVDKKITGQNNIEFRFKNFIKNNNASVEDKNNNKQKYKGLKFKNTTITQKKEEILATKSKIIFHINKIFYNMAQYSIKEKDYFISKFQLIDILKQGNIITPEIISLNETDIIITKLYPHKTKFNFSQFLNILTELCRFLYKENFVSSPKNAMDNFLSCLYNNYKEVIIEKNSNNFMEKFDDNSCTMKCLETVVSSKLERPIFKLMLTLYDNLVKIYKVYFPNEIAKYKSINEEKIMAESSQNLFKFWKDFEIFPTIMSKLNLNMYFNLLMKYLNEKNYINKVIINFAENNRYTDLGLCFKFTSFVLCLYHFCIFYHLKRLKFQYIHNDINKTNTDDSIEYDENLIDVDKIFFFFRKLENSSGIKKYLLKRGRTNDNRFNFIFKKKDIKIAKYEMDLWTNNIKDTNNKNYQLEKISLDITPYTSRQITEGKMEIEKNNIYDNESYLLTNTSYRNKNIFPNYNFNKYFLNINKKHKYLISISDLDDVLSVSDKVKEEIIYKIEKLSEIFLKYSKINNKLEYNRMSLSSFVKFLEDADLIVQVPEYKKNKYRKISDDIMSRTLTISTIKQFENTLKYSVSCNDIALSKEEIDYKKNVSRIVNTSRKMQNKKRLNISEVSLIFSSVTGSYNFPSYLNHIKNQFKENNDFEKMSLNDFTKKADYFEPKEEFNSQKDVPKKMNFALFIKSFELIAVKLYPKMLLDDAVLMFLELKIEPFICKRNNYDYTKNEIKKALLKMDNPKIKDILKKLGDIIHPFYLKFTQNKMEMQFYQFFTFYISLKLFPELISLSQMKQIFYFLCDNNGSNTNSEKEKNIKDRIDFDTFVKSLGISSMLFNFKNILTDTDRLLYIYYFILESSKSPNFIMNGNMMKKVQNNLKNNNANKHFRTKSCGDLNNRKIIINFDGKRNEYNCISKPITKFTFLDIYK